MKRITPPGGGSRAWQAGLPGRLCHASRRVRPVSRWLLCLVVGLAGWGASQGAFSLEAGAGRVDITPPMPCPLNGYGARMGRDSEGTHDPIWARALYLDDGTTRLFLVSIDHVAITPELRDRVMELAPDVVPPEHVLIAATHTHNGPGGTTRLMPFRLVSGRYMPEVVEHSAQGIARAMQEAYDNRVRAALGWTVVEQSLTRNRRYANGPVDPLMGVILVEDADGAPIAVVANLAAHPTSVGGEGSYLFSGDYPAYYYEEMEKLTRPECVALFLNGTEGNQTINPPPGGQPGEWARAEAMGRAVAQLAKQAMSQISCAEVTLRVGVAEPELPLSLSGSMLPRKAPLRTLEINDLIIHFLPGEPCVEIGLALRQQALARGYAAALNVGLANSYFLYFVPRSQYSEVHYESAMTFFGPDMEGWFSREFAKLMSRGASPEEPPLPDRPVITSMDGGELVSLDGATRRAGYQVGLAYADLLWERFTRTVVAPVREGKWYPEGAFWSRLPGWLDLSSLALPVLGMATRNQLKGMPDSVYEWMLGMAEGAGLPFDAIRLIQVAPVFSEDPRKEPLFAAPLCTMAAAVGVKAGADDVALARNLDWPAEERNVVTRLAPEGKTACLLIGFPWVAGAFSGMNDRGLAVSVERDEPLTIREVLAGAPVEALVLDILLSGAKFDEALARLQEATWIRKTRVLLAGMDGKNPRAAVVVFGDAVTVRPAEKNAYLPAVSAAEAGVTPETAARYEAVSLAVSGKRIIGEEDWKRALSQQGPGMDFPWNGQTRHSVIFYPAKGRALVSFRNASGGPGAWTELRVREP
ncbi:MAG TPA: neutral/alkaline non-lysosomal ceramidase N-terminal domain-containing protein [Candidatus Hydrogenedentes bacterium]|nr:neutral/alkaline non-lysosomal ceramidase N-terminal domain-containing protein [Candidatus Hydrogenedentota bacterium]